MAIPFLHRLRPRCIRPVTAALLSLCLPGSAVADSNDSHEITVVANVGHHGSFVDLANTLRPLELTYDSWFGQRRGKPRYLLAALENVGVLSVALSYYWLNADLNRVDWDLPTVSDRLTLRAWRFDNNSNLFNHILHPFGGANYYGLARINNLTVLESALYANASSFFWEFALEWRELVSINDLIFTPISGIAVGEFLFQLGEYVTSTPATKPWHHVGAYTFGLYRTVHDAAATNRQRVEMPEDSLGYSSAYWHRFRVEGEYVSIAGSGQVQNLYGLAAQAEIVAMPGFERPGRFAKNFASGNFTRGKLDIALGSDRGFDTDLYFSANVYGRYRQSYTASHSGDQLRGHADLIALDTAFRFSDHSFSDRKDQVAIVHAAGPATHLWYRAGDFRASINLGTTLDFAAIRSLAFEEWRKTHEVSGVKSVLTGTGYQYHLGASARVKLEAQYRGFGLGLDSSIGFYDSIEGLDRKQAEVTDDISGQESVIEYDGFLQIPVPATALNLRVALARFARASRIESLELRRRDTRLTGAIGATF